MTNGSSSGSSRIKPSLIRVNKTIFRAFSRSSKACIIYQISSRGFRLRPSATDSQQFSQQFPQGHYLPAHHHRVRELLNRKDPTTLELQQWFHRLHQLLGPLANLKGFRCGNLQVGQELQAGLTYLVKASLSVHYTESPNAHTIVASSPVATASDSTRVHSSPGHANNGLFSVLRVGNDGPTAYGTRRSRCTALASFWWYRREWVSRA